MAIITKYYSTTGAGAADGSTWADRAQLVSGGTYHTSITQFAGFAGSDSLVCRIGPGTYSPTAVLQATSFTGVGGTAPTISNPIIFEGADSSGNAISPPDPNWTSDQPSWSDSSLPVIATTTNILTISGVNAVLRMLKFTSSARSGAVISTVYTIDWCQILNSNSNAASQAAVTVSRITNSILSCTGSIYDAIFQASIAYASNNKFVGVAGSSGDRHGVEFTGSTSMFVIEGNTIIGPGGAGVIINGSNVGVNSFCRNNTIINCGSDGFQAQGTVGQNSPQAVTGNYISGCGGFGINYNASGFVLASDNRLRDNASGNFNGLGNWPTNLGNYTTDSNDATEFVNSGAGDYRIKAGSAIYGSGYGVSEESSSSVSIVAPANANGGVFQ